MNPRERWQTLQSHLSAARGALATSDKTAALEHIEAALAIDPEFLAARMLRDRVTSPDVETPVLSTIEPDVVARSVPAPPPPMTAAAAPVVSVSAAALASFEERVKQRVREREAGAARTAVAKRHRRRITAQLAAAAVFLTAISSTALYEPHMLQSRTITMSARLIDLEPSSLIVLDAVPPSPEVVTPSVGIPTAPTEVAVRAMVDTLPEPVREPPPAVQPTAPQPHVTQPAPQPAPAVTQTTPPPQQLQPVPSPTPRPVQMMPPRPMSDATVAANVATSSTSAVVPALLVSTADDRNLVDQTLQQYRRAYNKLDAESAHAVYPAVNAGALARAFDSLESQVLSFDSCETNVQGRYATVTCHGTSRYVPKVGNRVTHVEPRIWSFILRKDDEDWKIENARAAGGR